MWRRTFRRAESPRHSISGAESPHHSFSGSESGSESPRSFASEARQPMRLVPSFAPSVSQFREVVSAFRTGFEGTLPPLLDDIIQAIIEYAGYYVKDVSFSSDRMSGGDWEETYVISQPVDFDKGRIKEIKVDAEAHDQGWSSYPQDQNTYNNSWTFAELARIMPDGSLSASRDEIYRNLHAQSEQGRATRLESGLRWLNALPEAETSEALIRCCGSKRFASGLAARRPFRSFEDLQSAASDVWWNQVDISGWLEAFSAHPKIGDVASLKRKFATQRWSQGEQAAALQSSDDAFFQEMAECNRRYEQRFGHIFIICAQGKPASEILAALKERLANQPIYEVQLAAKEQEKITQLRLEKLLLDAPTNGTGTTVSSPATYRLARVAAHISPGLPSTAVPATVTPATSAKHPSISTHVLDVALGRPAAGIEVVLERQIEALRESDSGGAGLGWVRMGEGVTNADGRAAGLLARGGDGGGAVGGGVGAGIYRLSFGTGEYLGRMHGARGAGDAQAGSGSGGGFFPHVSIVFRVLPEQEREHFHVPLLLSPFSYSTYRGS
ncbi:unnamed protein product [Closterium sp. Yama58-4]|nr:unnamed protein product [Closterium sp. Yama58-4]